MLNKCKSSCVLDAMKFFASMYSCFDSFADLVGLRIRAGLVCCNKVMGAAFSECFPWLFL